LDGNGVDDSLEQQQQLPGVTPAPGAPPPEEEEGSASGKSFAQVVVYMFILANPSGQNRRKSSL